MSYTTDADLYRLIAARTLTQLAADDPQAEAPDPLMANLYQETET